jgi:hypothetical protein
MEIVSRNRAYPSLNRFGVRTHNHVGQNIQQEEEKGDKEEIMG